MNTSARALILMSTYQGEKYLAEQLESIIAQDLKDWTLLIRDDGSTDETLAIIHQFVKNDDRIQFLTDQLGNLKPAKSFSVLMSHAKPRTEPFIFFADQDDVWLPNKLQLGVSALEKQEKEEPVLVFSDLCVVDKNLKVIHPSFLRYEKLKPNKTSPLHTLLIHNYITGCTVGINRALLDLTCPVPETVIMHDWWCALCAAVFGKILFINEATVLYRQHSQNDVGSKGFYHKFKNWRRIKNSMLPRIEQANSLLQRVQKNNPHWNMLDIYCSLPHANLISRVKKLYQLKLNADGIIRQAGLLFLLIC